MKFLLEMRVKVWFLIYMDQVISMIHLEFFPIFMHDFRGANCSHHADFFGIQATYGVGGVLLVLFD